MEEKLNARPHKLELLNREKAILVFRFVTWIVPFAIGGLIVLLQRIRDMV